MLFFKVFGEKPTPEDDVCLIDIATDDIPEGYYKKSEVRPLTIIFSWLNILLHTK